MSHRNAMPRLTVCGSPAYLKEALRALTERYGDVPLSFVLAGSPTGSYTFQEASPQGAGPDAGPLPEGTVPN